jgi:DNA-binding GntR family transcriptional regulator
MSRNEGSYPQQAYEYVKARILNLRYRPGQFIMDKDIAAELQISRTPVREAFTRLQNEGLLVNAARRGWKVYSLSLHDIHEIFDIKVAVEGMVARQAAACDDQEHRAALRGALARMVSASEANDSAAWLRADNDLHDALYAMSGNARARRLVLNLNDQWHRVRIGFTALEGRMARSSLEHKRVIEAVLAGEGDEGERRMREHLNNVRADLVRMLTVLVMPFANDGI